MMTRRTRAVMNAGIAVAMTAVILLIFGIFAVAADAAAVDGSRAWWFVAWGAAIIGISAALGRFSTEVRHLACLGVSIAITLLHLLAHAAGLVEAGDSTQAVVLIDFVFLGSAIAALTVVSIRRRDLRDIDRDHG